MQLNHIKTAVAASWIAAVGAVGLVADIAQPASWFALAACALVPAGAMLWFWKPPAASMSESIRKALR